MQDLFIKIFIIDSHLIHNFFTLFFYIYEIILYKLLIYKQSTLNLLL